MKINKLISFLSISGTILGVILWEFPKVIAATESQQFSSIDLNQSQTLPCNTITINRSCYALGYDCRTRNAAWVYERLTADSLKGDASREIGFKEDPLAPEAFRVKDKDYRNSGFDRGHLAPAANHKSSQDEMNDTFYLSNISPQNPKLNRGYWAKLEKHVRDLTKSYAVVEDHWPALFAKRGG